MSSSSCCCLLLLLLCVRWFASIIDPKHQSLTTHKLTILTAPCMYRLLLGAAYVFLWLTNMGVTGWLSSAGQEIGRKLSRSRTRLLSTMTISSSSNQQVKLIRSLESKKGREESGLVVLEGFRLINDALQAGIQPHHILVSQSGQRSPLYGSLKGALLQAKIGASICSAVTDDVFRSLSNTVHGQGIVAAFRRPVYSSLQLIDGKKPQKPVVVVLDGISDPGNAGTILRSSYGLGASAVVGIQSCDLWAPKVIRASMGCGLRFPVFEESWSDAPAVLNRLLGDSYRLFIADGSGSGGIDYSAVDYSSESVVVLIGSEATGPSEKVHSLSKRSDRVYIPMLRPVESFNAGVAASIILAEVAKQRSKRAQRFH